MGLGRADDDPAVVSFTLASLVPLVVMSGVGRFCTKDGRSWIDGRLAALTVRGTSLAASGGERDSRRLRFRG